MKKISIFKILFLAISVIALYSSCGEDETKPAVTGEALFSYVADGFKVTFTNESTVSGTTTNAWDFGDNETSTEKNPVHTYTGKGEYSVTLTVTDADGGTHDITSKINVDKATRISLTDDSFDDWAAVTEPEYTVTLGDESGDFKSVVFDYDADNVYVKLTFDGALSDSLIFDVFIDSDFDASTGFLSALWPLAGLDVLVEGQAMLDISKRWFDLWYYNGMDQGWGYEVQPTKDHYAVGNIEEANGQVTVELGFDRSKVQGLDGDKAKFIFQLVSKIWAPIGWAPSKMAEGGDPTDGFTLEMK